MPLNENMTDFVFPILARSPQNNYKFLGSAIVLDAPSQVLLTCAHVIADADKDKIICLNKKINHEVVLNKFISDTRMDIALTTIPSNIKFGSKITLKEVISSQWKSALGIEIVSLGFISPNPNRTPIEIQPQIRKGYITWYVDTATIEPGAKSVNATSYPIPKGFSGGPIFLKDSTQFIGMSFGNTISEICLREVTDEHENGELKYQVRTSQIIETGLFHSIDDIKYFLAKNQIMIETTNETILDQTIVV